MAISGVGDLVADRILAEAGGLRQFGSDAALARHAGCSNRKLNAMLHVVLTQARVHPAARAYLARKRAIPSPPGKRSAASDDTSCDL